MTVLAGHLGVCAPTNTCKDKKEMQGQPAPGRYGAVCVSIDIGVHSCPSRNFACRAMPVGLPGHDDVDSKPGDICRNKNVKRRYCRGITVFVTRQYYARTRVMFM